jgi:hypothetical protein
VKETNDSRPMLKRKKGRTDGSILRAQASPIHGCEGLVLLLLKCVTTVQNFRILSRFGPRNRIKPHQSPNYGPGVFWPSVNYANWMPGIIV